jgi:hypothetical protein
VSTLEVYEAPQVVGTVAVILKTEEEQPAELLFVTVTVKLSFVP